MKRAEIEHNTHESTGHVGNLQGYFFPALEQETRGLEQTTRGLEQATPNISVETPMGQQATPNMSVEQETSVVQVSNCTLKGRISAYSLTRFGAHLRCIGQP